MLIDFITLRFLIVPPRPPQGERLAAEGKRRGPGQQGQEAGDQSRAERRGRDQHGSSQEEVAGRTHRHARPDQPGGTQRSEVKAERKPQSDSGILLA